MILEGKKLLNLLWERPAKYRPFRKNGCKKFVHYRIDKMEGHVFKRPVSL